MLIISLSFIQTAYAQENYIQGYIVVHEGDTIQGFIDYREWRINPEKIFFKGQDEVVGKFLYPRHIKSFKVSNDLYVSGEVKARYITSKVGNHQYFREYDIKKDSAFLLSLVEGEKNLYYYITSEGLKNFYIRENSLFELLEYHQKIVEDKGRKVIMEDKRYIGQLAYYFRECPEIQSRLIHVDYNVKSMKKIFRHFYNCTGNSSGFIKKDEKLLTRYGMLGGFSLSTLKFNSPYFSYLVYADYRATVDLSGGIWFDIILPREQAKWSLNNELMFSSYKVKGECYESAYATPFIYTFTEIGYSYIKLNNMLRFTYPIRELFIFVNIGMSNGFALKETNYQYRVNHYYASVNFFEGKALKDTRKYEQGLILGTGVVLKRYSAELRLEKGTGMSEYSVLNSRANRVFLLFRYRF